MSDYVDAIVRLMGHVYPEVVDNRELVERVILSEEERFGVTLRQGQAYLADALEKLEGTVLDGATAFSRCTTPTASRSKSPRRYAPMRASRWTRKGFERCMEQQRERARAATKDDAEAAWSTYGGIHDDLLKRTRRYRLRGL